MTLYQGLIIDTHMHLWDISQGHTWLPQMAEGALHHNFFPPDYLKLCRNQPIAQMVSIECGGFPDNPVLESKWLQTQADKYGFPQGIVSFAKFTSPDVDKVLKAHTAYPNV